jgi:hypothetical protein
MIAQPSRSRSMTALPATFICGCGHVDTYN